MPLRNYLASCAPSYLNGAITIDPLPEVTWISYNHRSELLHSCLEASLWVIQLTGIGCLTAYVMSSFPLFRKSLKIIFVQQKYSCAVRLRVSRNFVRGAI